MSVKLSAYFASRLSITESRSFYHTGSVGEILSAATSLPIPPLRQWTFAQSYFNQTNTWTVLNHTLTKPTLRLYNNFSPSIHHVNSSSSIVFLERQHYQQCQTSHSRSFCFGCWWTSLGGDQRGKLLGNSSARR